MSAAVKIPEVDPSLWAAIRREADFNRYVAVYVAVQDTPWNDDRAFFGDAKLLRFIVEQGMANRGKVVPFVSFNAEMWELEGVRFHFRNIPDDLFEKARKFVLYEIIKTQWRSFRTVLGKLQDIRHFFRLYGESHPYFYFRYLHEDGIRETLDKVESLNVKRDLSYSLLVFYEFLQANYPDEPLPVDLEAVRDICEECRKLHSFYHVSEGYPAIPTRLFLKIYLTARDVMRDATAYVDRRVAAAMLVVMIWTGLRPQEVLLLRRGCLCQRRESGEDVWFYEYQSPKCRNQELMVYLFPAAVEAINVLEGIQQERGSRSDFLIEFKDVKSPSGVPVTCRQATCKAFFFYWHYMREEFSAAQPGTRHIEVARKHLWRPVFYSYRVSLYNYLLGKGYSSKWVEKHLGHLSDSIRGHYMRVTQKKKIALQREYLDVVDDGSYVMDAARACLDGKPVKALPARQDDVHPHGHDTGEAMKRFAEYLDDIVRNPNTR